MYVRAQNDYNVRQNKLYGTSLELSRTLFKSGRLNLGASYNHLSKIINTQIGLILDLGTIRSTTSINTFANNITARQSFNGSIGTDIPNRNVSFSSRQQVSQSAISVILFVDMNNSGQYDSGDQLLPYRCIKIDRSATVNVGKDSILRLSHLQSYYKYNLSINRNAIPDPTLVPLKDKFSFIADPNQFKRIEIPFYRGGTAEGAVLIERNGITTGQGGLRLTLKSVNSDFETIIRTMNDGGFYIMDLAPGKYTLQVDSMQLGFLNVKQPEKFNFEVKATSEGDFIEGLNIKLMSDEELPAEMNLPDTNKTDFPNQQSVDLENQIIDSSDTLQSEEDKVVGNLNTDINKNANKVNVKVNNKTNINKIGKNAVISSNNDNQEKSILSETSIISDTRETQTLLPTFSAIPKSSPVKFPHNSSYLTPSFKLYLDTLAIALKQETWSTLIIYGNADSTGTSLYNKWISIRRAERVKSYLVKKKISSEKIITVGNGSEKPLVTNNTKTGLEMNRRIDIELKR